MSESATKEVRLDHKVITDLVKPKSNVLDLGCGTGELLALLIKEKKCKGTGIEIDEEAIYACVEKGLSVNHGDIDTGLNEYTTKRFDYVILNESLQQILHPKQVILEALRVGKKVVVGIPNFCHIDARLQIFFRGRVPITKELPYQWHDTPNLRFVGLKDFRKFCRKNKIVIETETGVNTKRIIHFWPNLRANVGIFLLHKD